MIYHPSKSILITEASKIMDLEFTDLRGVKPNIDSYSAFFDNCKAAGSIL